MCQWGNTTDLLVPIPANLSAIGEAKWKIKPIDSCLANLVQALNDAGIYTAGCCCGHGHSDGSIILHDCRVLIIKTCADRTEADLLRCEDCGIPYKDFPLDVVLPDDQWEAITGYKDGEGILCASCIVKRGSRLASVTVAKLVFE